MNKKIPFPICNDSNIEGISAAGTKIKMAAYADDTRLYYYTTFALEQLFNKVETFHLAATGKTNYNKSSAILTKNPINSEPLQPIPLGQSDRLLGYQLGIVHPNEQWKATINKFLTECSKWQNHSVSLIGKATGVKVFLAPILEYISSLVPHTQTTLKTAQQAMWKVLFNNQTTTRIKFNNMYLPLDCGGFNIPNLELRAASNLARWKIRLETPTKEPWKFLFKDKIQQITSKDNPYNPWNGEPNKALLNHGTVGAALYWWRLAVKNNPELAKMKPDKVTLKVIYKSLANLTNPTPLPIYNNSTTEPLQLNKMWKHLHKTPLPPAAKTMRFRSWHNKLILHHHENSHTLTPCPHCQEIPSNLHILTTCPIAIHLRDGIIAVWNKQSKKEFKTLYWDEDWIPKDTFSAAQHLALDSVMATAKHTLWTAYTNTKFGNKTYPSTLTPQLANKIGNLISVLQKKASKPKAPKHINKAIAIIEKVATYNPP